MSPIVGYVLYDWSHVIQKDVQLILMPPWLDRDAPKKRQEPPTTSAFRKAYIPWVHRNGTVVEAPKVLWGFHRWKWLEYQNNAIAQKKHILIYLYILYRYVSK